MKIERPSVWEGEVQSRVYKGAVVFSERVEAALNEWFDEHVEPVNRMLETGTEVYSCSDFQCFYKDPKLINMGKQKEKGLLINVQPIKKESAEDVLRDWIEFEDDQEKKHGKYVTDKLPKLIKRAKAVLERKDLIKIKVDPTLEDSEWYLQEVNEIYKRAKRVLGEE